MDLKTNRGVEKYLRANHFNVVSVVPILGGLANFTYRANLQQPFEGHMSIIVKHAAPFLSSQREVLHDQKRLHFEREVLAYLSGSRIFSFDSITQIPKVYLYDPINHVLIMQDCGDLPTLIQLLADKQLNKRVATKIGSELGTFLARLHLLGHQNEYLMQTFQNSVKNVTWKLLLSYIQSNTETGDLSFSKEEKKVLSDMFKSQTEYSTNGAETLIMGDFWGGNVLVDIDPKGDQLKRLYIIDWETTRYDLPYHDIGHFSPDFLFVSRLKDPASCSVVLTSFLRTYAKIFKPDVEYVRNAAVVLGAILIVWTPRNVSETRNNIKLGMDYFVKASMKETAWLQESILKDLIKGDSDDEDEG